MNKNEPYNETALIAALAKGSITAFDAIYLRYFDLLVTHISGITKSKTVAEDIVQDVFMRLWDRRLSFAGYHKMSGWLFVASYNSSISYLRQQSRNKSRLVQLGYLSVQDEEKNFKEQEAQFRLMEEAVERLPPQRRRVFLLCKYNGLTYDQAAMQLSISRNTVKEHLSKASESIREYIQNASQHSIELSSLLFCLMYVTE